MVESGPGIKGQFQAGVSSVYEASESATGSTSVQRGQKVQRAQGGMAGSYGLPALRVGCGMADSNVLLERATA